MSRVEQLISILKPAPKCPVCETKMVAGVTYAPTLYEHVDCWACPADDCTVRLYRDEDDSGPSFRGVARRITRRRYDWR